MQVVTSLIVLALFFVVFIISDIRSYKQRKVNDMIGLAQVLGTNTTSALQFQDNEAATKILHESNGVIPAVEHAVVFDKAGNVFASYAKKNSADSFHVPGQLKKNQYLFTGKHLFVTSDIINENEKIGEIVIETDFSELKQINATKFRIAAFLLLVAVGFSFLVALLLQSYISKRLLYLVSSMKEVGRSGDYTKPIEEGGKDEIGTLSKAFNNLMQRVNENQQRKDQFISIASHELKTPLTTIKGYLELLDRRDGLQPDKQFVQKALKNANKLDNLIKDLLDVSKIQSGQLKLNMQEFSLDHLLDETITATQLVHPNHEIVREGNFGDQTVCADRLRIEQVLNNLLSNAIKYSPDGKKVIVYALKTQDELIIKVRDFGIGIPEAERTNIFERFYRTKDMPVNISGFGLGLYISRDIVKRHNGNIWVEPEEKGTAFYFSLPAITAHSSENGLS